MKRESIAFGIYKDGKLIGFRADSFGSIRNKPKIYGNTEKQIKIVTDNYEHTVSQVRENNLTSFAGTIGKFNSDAGRLFGASLSSLEKTLQELGEFELRVIPCPSNNEDWSYPKEEIEEWLHDLPDSIQTFEYKI